MVTYVVGDLFTSPAQVLVNTVNTVGVMGKGLAYTFKRVYPEMFQEYRRQCENKSLTVGTLFLYKSPQKWILNFPTKKHWRAKSRIEYIEAGLEEFTDSYKKKEIRSISFPMLGCQHGGLDWADVQPLMEHYLADLPAEIKIYIHLYRPDLLPFPDNRNLKSLKAHLTGNMNLPSFEDFWHSMQPYICKEQVQLLWEELQHGQYVRLRDLPEAIQPNVDGEGCVYVEKLEREQYLIGHRNDRKRLERTKYVEVILTKGFLKVERELHDKFASHKIPGTRKQFNLNDSQIAEIKKYANGERRTRLNRLAKDLPHDVDMLRSILMCEGSEPTCNDIGWHLVPTQIKSKSKQRKLL